MSRRQIWIEGQDSMKAIALPKKSAEKELRSILRSGIVDKKKKITADSAYVYVPVLADSGLPSHRIVDIDLQERPVQEAPIAAISRRASEFGIKEALLPRRWVRYGDSIIIRYGGPEPKHLAEVIAGVLNAKSVYRYSGRISGVLRVPSLELLFGNGGSVTHLENGIRYAFDPSKVMFSPGNVGVRGSMKHLDVKGKTIFDMFSGIGYFSIPLAKYGFPHHIYAAEINPDSYQYLLINIRKNKVQDVFTTYNADCSTLNLPEKADLIVMGHFSSPSYIQHAVNNLGIGGVIMMHHLVSSENLKHSAQAIEKKLQDCGKEYRITSSRVVKSYSPHHWHVVTEVVIS
ncbi:MAG: class I SAM-dependent methyltransferase [Thermoplasmata archaeon]